MYLYNAVNENCRLVIQVQVDENIEADDKYLHRRYHHPAPLRALDPLEVCFFLCCFFMFKKYIYF